MKMGYVILCGCLLSVGMGYVIGHDLGLVKLAEHCKAIGELSTLIFGVIGMWLSLLYRDEIITNLWSTKSNEAKVRAARLVVVAHDRCHVLCRGFYLSAVVLLIVYAIMFVGINVIRATVVWLRPGELLVSVGKYSLALVVAICGVVQLYVLLSCVSPMLSIMTELRRAKRDAERIIELESGGADDDL